MKKATITKSHFVLVDGGRVDVWLRDDGMYGVTLLRDDGRGSRSFTSAEWHEGFPAAYSESALLMWGRERWARRLASLAA